MAGVQNYCVILKVLIYPICPQKLIWGVTFGPAVRPKGLLLTVPCVGGPLIFLKIHKACVSFYDTPQNKKPPYRGHTCPKLSYNSKFVWQVHRIAVAILPSFSLGGNPRLRAVSPTHHKIKSPCFQRALIVLLFCRLLLCTVHHKIKSPPTGGTPALN